MHVQAKATPALKHTVNSAFVFCLQSILCKTVHTTKVKKRQTGRNTKQNIELTYSLSLSLWRVTLT